MKRDILLSFAAAVILIGFLVLTNVRSPETSSSDFTPSKTGTVFFPQGALDVIKARIQDTPQVARVVQRYMARAEAAANTSPRPRTSLDIADKLESDDASLATEEFNTILALGLNAALYGDTVSSAKAEEYLVAWARTYVPMGHPNVESGFMLYVMAYELVRDRISSEARSIIDDFLGRLYESQVANLGNKDFNILQYANKWSTHCANTAVLAFLRDNPEEIQYVKDCYQGQLTYNIYPAGTFKEFFPEAVERYPDVADTQYEKGVTLDFIHRDALSYHVASVGGLFTAALIAENNGLSWFQLEGAKSQRLSWAFDFLIPYATGEKKHYEFGNTLLQWDKDNERGEWFDAKLARQALTLAARIDPKYRQYGDSASLDDVLVILAATFSPKIF